MRLGDVVLRGPHSTALTGRESPARGRHRAHVSADVSRLLDAFPDLEPTTVREPGSISLSPTRSGRVSGRACKLVGVITLLLLPCGHHSRAGSPDNVAGRRPRVCRSAEPYARPGRAVRSPGSSAPAAPCSGPWPPSRLPRSPRTPSRSALRAVAG